MLTLESRWRIMTVSNFIFKAVASSTTQPPSHSLFCSYPSIFNNLKTKLNQSFTRTKLFGSWSKDWNVMMINESKENQGPCKSELILRFSNHWNNMKYIKVILRYILPFPSPFFLELFWVLTMTSYLWFCWECIVF